MRELIRDIVSVDWTVYPLQSKTYWMSSRHLIASGKLWKFGGGSSSVDSSSDSSLLVSPVRSSLADWLLSPDMWADLLDGPSSARKRILPLVIT